MKIVVAEVGRTRPRQHRRWTAHIADTGQQIVPPDREPEFRTCLALHHGMLGERYNGPVKFYRPGETAPYFLVASAGAIAQYEALTPGQMFEVMVQNTSDRDRARLIPKQLHSRLKHSPTDVTRIKALKETGNGSCGHCGGDEGGSVVVYRALEK
jgi:hypothetical protein